ncbi:MAG: aminoacyl-tRNA hydrolase [Candidatus Paceibacterota bacterium]
MENKFKYRLIIGLGNPGAKYAPTYHNAGKLAIAYLMETAAETMTLVQKGKQKNFEYFKFADGGSLIFVQPLTFMNESGKAVAACLKYFGVKPKETLVIHDDSDIGLGESKLSFGRGAAGHHGIESIIDNLKTDKFWRLRIGIRKKGKEGTKRKEAGLPADFVGRRRLRRPKAEAYRTKAGEMVLRKISPADNLILKKVIKDLEI